MGTENISKIPTSESVKKVLSQKESKFSLVSCPIKESLCHKVLNEINELYAESELARINKEYLTSVSLLEEAYNKTSELNHKSCLVCADLIKHHIEKTIEVMKGELHEISNGVFGKNNYKLIYAKLCNWVNK